LKNADNTIYNKKARMIILAFLLFPIRLD